LLSGFHCHMRQDSLSLDSLAVEDLLHSTHRFCMRHLALISEDRFPQVSAFHTAATPDSISRPVLPISAPLRDIAVVSSYVMMFHRPFVAHRLHFPAHALICY
jgi:hypothetical protein